MSRRIKLSQCMIVKNEEENLEKALSWGRGIVWERIVVDTGSTDHTVALAERMGAEVYHFDWIGDFSAAKNFAISKAKGDWIAFLDADEYPAPEDEKKIPLLLEMLEEKKYDAMYSTCLNLNSQGEVFMSGSLIRFFKNRRDLCYRRRVHEQLICTSERELRAADAGQELAIIHTGYAGEVYEKKMRSRRNLKLITEEVEENPQDYEMMGYLGDEYRSYGEVCEAKEWYRRAIAAMPERISGVDQRSSATFSGLLGLLMMEEREEPDGISWVYDEGVRRLPEESDFDYMMGRYYASRGDNSRGAFFLEQALTKLEKYGNAGKAMILGAELPDAYELLSRCCYESGERAKAVNYGVALLNSEKYRMAALIILLKAFRDDGPYGTPGQACVAFLQKIYDFQALRDRIFILEAAKKVNFDALEEAMYTCFTEEERKNLEREEADGRE